MATVLEWRIEGGKHYWYEDGVKQGVFGDPKNVWYNGIERGREIYDPGTNAWYWLDSNNGGARAESKEVFIPYIYQDEPEGSTEGKWVRYDGNGKMIKGLFISNNKVYVYRQNTGAMVKGTETISFAFDQHGVCLSATVS